MNCLVCLVHQTSQTIHGDVQDILGSWMRENKILDWSSALPIVMNIKNSKFNRNLGMCPYKAVFGMELYNGLDSETSIPSNERDKIKTAKQLYALIGTTIFVIS